MNKIIGYIIAAIGLVGVAAYVIPEFKDLVPFLDQVTNTILLIASIIIIIIGIFFIIKGGRRKMKAGELPIYQGGNVVAYRQH